jgi:tetratricopeptide (TPR) repeat protein
LLVILTLVGDPSSRAASRPTWIQLRSPNFIVVTNDNEKHARLVARQFELIRGVFLQYFRRSGSTDPAITILAAKDEQTLRGLVPEFWQKKNSMHPAGMFLDGGDANWIVLRLDVSLTQAAYVPYAPVYHEYVHYLMRRLKSGLPLWMVEGLAEVYGNTRIESKEVRLGALSVGNLIQLHQHSLLPVKDLFNVDVASPYYHEENKTSIFYAESWALTHYLIARDWTENTTHVNDFIDLLGKGIDQKEAAARTIGDTESLDAALRRYIDRTVFTAVGLRPPSIDESSFQTREMSEAESLTSRADFMAHNRRYAEAQAMLEEAFKMDPMLGAACESMSFLYLVQRNYAGASKWVSQALALNPQSLRANFYDAVTLMDSGARDEQTLSQAESRLRTVLKVNPEFSPAYDVLAFVLSQPGPTQKLDEAYMATVQAVTRDPSNIHYRIRSVEVLEKQGRTEDAIRVATLADSLARTSAEKSEASASLAGAKQPRMAQAVQDIQRKLGENLRTDKNAKTDLGQDVEALTKLLDSGSLDATSDAGARFFRAAAQLLLGNCRRQEGLVPDTAAAEQALSDLDRIIAGKSDIPGWGITIPNVEYYAGLIAWTELHSDSRAYSYWQRCSDNANAGCMGHVALAYTIGSGGMQPDAVKALDLDLKIFDTGTTSRCAGAHAAQSIATLIYFTATSYPKDNDPVSWMQKSYALSDPIEAYPSYKDGCDGSEARIEEFLYRLARGDRQDKLLVQAAQRLDDNSPASAALINYLSGSLDAKAFEAVVQSSKSDSGRCYAYFHAMWYANLSKDTALVDRFYGQLLKFDQLTCPSYLAFAKKFHPEGPQTRPPAPQR